MGTDLGQASRGRVSSHTPSSGHLCLALGSRLCNQLDSLAMARYPRLQLLAASHLSLGCEEASAKKEELSSPGFQAAPARV